MAWSFAAKTARVLDTLAESAQAIGPLGGQLSSEGYGDRRELVEAMTGGARHSYGHLPFALDGRAASGVRSADGKRSIVGVRLDRKSVVVGKECVSTCRSRWSPFL